MGYSIGDVFDLEVTNLSDLGSGFGRIDGSKKVFVNKSCPEDQIQVKLIKENSKIALADLLTIKKASQFRVDAPCRYFEKCGGCELQHLKADYYQHFKKSIISNCLARNQIDFNHQINWVWINQSSRRRAVLQVNQDNKIGFFKAGSNFLVEIDHCLMLEKELANLVPHIKLLLEKLPKSLINQIHLNKFDNGVLVIFSLNIKNPNWTDGYNQNLLDFVKENNLLGLSLKENDLLIPIYQASSPELIWDKIKINPPENSFLQATKFGEKSIINQLIKFIKNESPLKFIADLYSGVGTYSFALSNLFFEGYDFRIDAFEGKKVMAESIKQNALKNNLQGKIKSFTRDLVTNPLTKAELEKYDLILINPSRNGANSQIKNLVKSKTKNIIMISCDPYSFASDAKLLTNNNYKITDLTVIDQFYYTHHLELVAIFQKIN